MISTAEAARAEKILIINVTRIGDTLLNTPAVRAIAAWFPNAKITYLGHPKRVEVVENLPFLTKVGTITKKIAPLRGWANQLLGPDYDYAFVWGNDLALIRYALRKAKRVIAYASRQSTITARLYCAVEEPPLYSRHAVAMQLSLIEAVGLPAAGRHLAYQVTDAEKNFAQHRLGMDVPKAASPLIGFQAVSFPTKSWRDWPISHFAELARCILNIHPDAHFVLLGGPDDLTKVGALAQLIPGKSTIYAGQLTLRQTAAIMNELDLYVGVDTGPTHLFGALGKPMVALYHPTIPSTLYKPLDHPALFAIDHPMAGKTLDTAISMAEISVDVVMSRVRDALAKSPA